MRRGAELRRLTALVQKTELKRTQWKRTVKGDSPLLRKSKRQLRERSGGLCEVQLPEICTGRYEQANHVKPRARGGSDRLANLDAVCTPCHQHLTTHPDEAHRLGLTLHSWDEERSG